MDRAGGRPAEQLPEKIVRFGDAVGAVPAWTALAGDRFRLLAEDGSIAFSSEALGLTMAPYAIASAPSAFGEDIVVGARYGYHLYRFSGARIFSDSFEVN